MNNHFNYQKHIAIEIKVNYKYSQQQTKALETIDVTPSTYLRWKRGEGKTFIVIDAMMRRALQFQDYACLYGASSYSHARMGYEYAREWLKKNPTIEATVKQVINGEKITFNNDASISFHAINETCRIGHNDLKLGMVAVDDWSMFTMDQKLTADKIARSMDMPVVPLGNSTQRRFVICEAVN